MARKQSDLPAKTLPDALNRDVLQSYALTMSRHDSNIYEERILLGLVREGQAFLHGERGLAGRVIERADGDKEVTLDLTDLVIPEDGSPKYERLKEAARNLVKRVFEYKNGKAWICFAPIYHVKITPQDSTMVVKVNKDFWDALLNFVSGWRRYEFQSALMLRSVYAMRFYQLFSEQKEPITYQLDELKKMFRVEDKYQQTGHFIARVLEPAKRELDQKAPWGFDYQPVKSGRAITGFRFTPYKIARNEDVDLEDKRLNRKLRRGVFISRTTAAFLSDTVGMDEVEIKNTRSMFGEAEKLVPNFEVKLREIWSRAQLSKRGTPIAYLVGTMKKELEKAKALILDAKAELDSLDASNATPDQKRRVAKKALRGLSDKLSRVTASPQGRGRNSRGAGTQGR